MMGSSGPDTFGDPLQSMGMDLAPYKMPIVGGFFQDPNELHQKQQFHNMAVSYGAYRPEAQQANMNALRNTSTMFQPYQDAMASVYGPQTAMTVPTQSPVSPGMQQIGNPYSGAYSPGEASGGGFFGSLIPGIGNMGGIF